MTYFNGSGIWSALRLPATVALISLAAACSDGADRLPGPGASNPSMTRDTPSAPGDLQGSTPQASDAGAPSGVVRAPFAVSYRRPAPSNPLTSTAGEVRPQDFIGQYGRSFRYEWGQGQPPVTMINMNDGICVLQAVIGNFQGGGEDVNITLDANNNWTLSGISQQQGVGAIAACAYWWSSFIGGSQVNFTSGFGTAQNANEYLWGYGSTWPDVTSFCFMGAASGWFGTAYDGFLPNNYVTVTGASCDEVGLCCWQGTCGPPPQDWALQADSAYGAGGCFGFDRKLHMSAPFFNSYEAALGQSVALPNANQAFCGLNSIGGLFQSATDYALIGVDSSGNQTLYAGARSYGMAVCVDWQLD